MSILQSLSKNLSSFVPSPIPDCSDGCRNGADGDDADDGDDKRRRSVANKSLRDSNTSSSTAPIINDKNCGSVSVIVVV